MFMNSKGCCSASIRCSSAMLCNVFAAKVQCPGHCTALQEKDGDWEFEMFVETDILPDDSGRMSVSTNISMIACPMRATARSQGPKVGAPCVTRSTLCSKCRKEKWQRPSTQGRRELISRTPSDAMKSGQKMLGEWQRRTRRFNVAFVRSKKVARHAKLCGLRNESCHVALPLSQLVSTPPKTNMEPENTFFEKEKDLQTTNFGVPC